MQLHTSRQLARHTHDWVPYKHHSLEEVVRQQNQAEIIESAEADNLQHPAAWEEVWCLLGCLMGCMLQSVSYVWRQRLYK